MKYLFLLMLFLLLTVEKSPAQISADSSKVSIIEKKWQVKKFSPPNSAVNEDPLNRINQTTENIRDLKNTAAYNRNNQNKGLRAVAPSLRSDFNLFTPFYDNKTRIAYVYQIKVLNNGTKTIKEVTWDYVFLDAVTRQQVGVRQFTSKTKLKPNQTGKLFKLSYKPPTDTLKETDVKKKINSPYIEQINIKSIQYSDGSVWQMDSK